MPIKSGVAKWSGLGLCGAPASGT